MASISTSSLGMLRKKGKRELDNSTLAGVKKELAKPRIAKSARIAARLPYPQPDKLVAIHGHDDTWNAEIAGEQNVACPDFSIASAQAVLSRWLGLSSTEARFSEPGEPEYVDLIEITSDLCW
jgi:hypothetical protein